MKGLGGLGAVMLLDCATGNTLAGGTDGGTADLTTNADLSPISCVLDPNVTKGPYWIDEKLQRSDITSDGNGVAAPNPRPGLPVTLRIGVFSYAARGCTALSGAQVDIWHCDASGLYSDVANMGGANLVGQNFLRGYQITDGRGIVTFQTIYPGWYRGRAVHVHVKIRQFDPSNNTTTEATTQLFFDDAVSDAVYAANGAYGGRGARDTRNSGDMIYSGHSELLVNLTGDEAAGFTATAILGIAVGTLSAG